MPVRIGAFASETDSDSYLRFLKQYGVEDVVLGLGERLLAKFPPDGAEKPGYHIDFLDLVQVRTRFEDAGLRVVALENPAPKQYFVSVMLGLPGRDAVIEDLIATIRNFGRAGIPTIGYHWMVNPPGQPSGSSRTSHTTPGRGGAQVGSFHWEDAQYAPLARGREYTEDEMWANYEYFIRAVIPACEEAGVSLAMHPPDPPVESLGGAPRLFHTFEGFQRAMEIADSPMSGLNLCLGNWTAMGTDIVAAVKHFGSKGQIFYGHAQGVNGVAPTFDECFLDEADCDFLAVIRALNDVGFDSCLAPAHFPRTVGDTHNARNGYAFAFGYLRALIQAASPRDG